MSCCVHGGAWSHSRHAQDWSLLQNQWKHVWEASHVHDPLANLRYSFQSRHVIPCQDMLAVDSHWFDVIVINVKTNLQSLFRGLLPVCCMQTNAVGEVMDSKYSLHVIQLDFVHDDPTRNIYKVLVVSNCSRFASRTSQVKAFKVGPPRLGVRQSSTVFTIKSSQWLAAWRRQPFDTPLIYSQTQPIYLQFSNGSSWRSSSPMSTSTRNGRTPISWRASKLKA